MIKSLYFCIVLLIGLYSQLSYSQEELFTNWQQATFPGFISLGKYVSNREGSNRSPEIPTFFYQEGEDSPEGNYWVKGGQIVKFDSFDYFENVPVYWLVLIPASKENMFFADSALKNALNKSALADLTIEQKVIVGGFDNFSEKNKKYYLVDFYIKEKRDQYFNELASNKRSIDISDCRKISFSSEEYSSRIYQNDSGIHFMLNSQFVCDRTEFDRVEIIDAKDLSTSNIAKVSESFSGLLLEYRNNNFLVNPTVFGSLLNQVSLTVYNSYSRNGSLDKRYINGTLHYLKLPSVDSFIGGDSSSLQVSREFPDRSGLGSNLAQTSERINKIKNANGAVYLDSTIPTQLKQQDEMRTSNYYKAINERRKDQKLASKQKMFSNFLINTFDDRRSKYDPYKLFYKLNVDKTKLTKWQNN